MIDGVLTWVFNIAVYIILITLILQLLPDRFKKFLNFYTGILLMLIAIKPVTKLLNMDTSIDAYFEVGEMGIKLDEIGDSLSLTRDVTEEKLIEEYNVIIEEGITEVITEYGYTILDIFIEWELESLAENYGSIKGVDLILREKSTEGTLTGIRPVEPVVIGRREDERPVEDKPEIMAIKNKLAGFYNLSEAHINIIIQE